MLAEVKQRKPGSGRPKGSGKLPVELEDKSKELRQNEARRWREVQKAYFTELSKHFDEAEIYQFKVELKIQKKRLNYNTRCSLMIKMIDELSAEKIEAALKVALKE